MVGKENFLLYNNMYDAFEELTDADAGNILKSLFKYSMYNELPEYEKGSPKSLVFKSVKTSIDINNKKYEETCKKNTENIKKRWEKKLLKVILDNQDFTKEEYEKYPKKSELGIPFLEIFNIQKTLFEEGNISEIKKRFNNNFTKEETIKKIFE